MRIRSRMYFIFAAKLVLIIFACYPHQRAVEHNLTETANYTVIDHPTKVYFKDMSVAIFQNGLEIKHNIIRGRGLLYSFDRQYHKSDSIFVPLDSVVAMTYYEKYQSPGSGFANFLHGLYGIIFTPLSIYCISCPKCCFGSCPTVYDLRDSTGLPVAELFSYNISRFFQEYDLDRLLTSPDESQSLRLRLTNEALETHYIDLFQVLKVTHPPGTAALPTPSGTIKIIDKFYPPRSAVRPDGQDITFLIRDSDTLTYRTGDKFAERVGATKPADWLDMEFEFEAEISEFNMVFRLRNTLLTTLLFYDLVLGQQGVEAISWTARMQNDYFYARLFTELYKQYGGIRFYVLHAGEWVKVAEAGDIGPIAWKDLAVPIHLPALQSHVTVRIEFFPDNILIDQVRAGLAANVIDGVPQIVPPLAITDNRGAKRDDLIDRLATSDQEYVVTSPGEYFELTYPPDRFTDGELTYFIRSKGYYIEWLRGDWIRNSPSDQSMSFLNQKYVLQYISDCWQKERPLLESAFFNSRIPLRRSP